LDPRRCIYRRAIKQGVVAVDPYKGLDDLEKPAKRKVRVPSLKETRALLAALPEDQRSVWATAAYAGLRHGELRALRWSDVGLKARTIRVERGWDDKEGAQESKTEKGVRTVRIVAELLPILLAHRAATGRRGSDLVFGPGPDAAGEERPFPSAATRRRRRRHGGPRTSAARRPARTR
jgi:integrase